jgi:ppGpp synthetase/RelA/SpoT-type nucleotidyltranferase
MTERGDAAERRGWLGVQVREYKRLHPRYVRYAALLEQVLLGATERLAPLAIVQTRPKSVASFAEKALRKQHKYADPVHEFTDLCGARVIARTRSEVEALNAFVKERFEIDWENSIDASERLAPSEFGYRSAHYIVSLGPGSDVGLHVPEPLLGLKAEVQIRTTAEHAWADVAHDLSYKGAFELPARWQRELAVIAAELEEVDHAFSRLEEGLQAYASSYESYMSKEQIREEIETLETVLAYDPRNAKLAARIGKLAMTVGDWPKAVDVLSEHVDPADLDQAYPPALRDLGVSLCKVTKKHPTGRDYRRGQRYLEKAVELDPRDCDAIASLAGTWRGIDEDRAFALYRQAFEVDPADSYSLGNVLEYELERERSTAVLAPLRPVMAAAVERCRAQAEVGINLPWVFFGLGELHLLLGETYESLRAYAKGVQASTAAFMITGSANSIAKLSVVGDELAGYEWVRRLLLLGLAARFPSPEALEPLRALAPADRPPVEGPVVIVVGSTDPRFEQRIQSYRELMLEAFGGFRGTVLSGGTRQGVSGLVGAVTEAHSGVHSIGYLPAGALPEDAVADDRYSEIRRTDGAGFSPLEPIQNWVDLLLSGVRPEDVKVLGISGGEIAAIEYRIALALGASVGVIEDTGREVSRLLADEQWTVAETLLPLPHDAQTVRAFIGSGVAELAPESRETIGRTIHDAYREEMAVPALPPWEELDEEFRESNRLQAEHIFAKLGQIGCGVEHVTGREIALMTFTDGEVEVMAEMEHGRWTAERLAHGWRAGEHRDDERKTSPYLVAWSELPDEIRERDRQTVRRIPAYLASIGLELVRRPTPA